MHYKPAVVVFFLFAQSDIIAKTDTIPHLLTGLQFHYGFIIPHSESIRNVSYTNPYGIELSRRNFHTSFKDWQVFNAYWISGVEVSYFNFQNPEILGYAFAVSAFAEPVIIHVPRISPFCLHLLFKVNYSFDQQQPFLLLQGGGR